MDIWCNVSIWNLTTTSTYVSLYATAHYGSLLVCNTTATCGCPECGAPHAGDADSHAGPGQPVDQRQTAAGTRDGGGWPAQGGPAAYHPGRLHFIV